ncbi:MAG: hypothetical protein KAH17_02110 [Bacteroidales bacterium]|nr:hypothetical protein [Bacteroidales bacterium]
MLKRLSLVILSLCLSSLLSAQNIDSESYGKPIIKIFANYHHGILDESSKTTAFEIQRAYLGYKHNFNPYWKATVKLDIGSPDDFSLNSSVKRGAYFKSANIEYNKDRIRFGIGLVDMYHIGFIENIWGHRYIIREYQDLHKYGSKADIGIFGVYRLSKSISIDAFIVNGEGYKNIQRDDTYKYGGAITIKAGKKVTARIHYDITPKENVQQSFVYYVGYQVKNNITVGFEGVYQINSKSQKDADLYGYSFFGMYHLNDTWELFARIDQTNSNWIENDADPWNLSKDGRILIGGIQYHPTSFLKFALNYQDWAIDMDNSHKSYIYVNMEVAF